MAYDPRADPSNLMGYDRNYKPVTGADDKDKDLHNAATLQNLKEDAAVWGSGESERAARERIQRLQGTSAEDIANIQGATQRDTARTQADAVRDAAKIRAGGYNAPRYPGSRDEYGYANGGPVTNKPDPRASRRDYKKGGSIF